MMTNRKFYRELKTIKDKAEGNRWVVTGGLNGHIELMEEMVNRNGQLIFNFAEDTKLGIKK